MLSALKPANESICTHISLEVLYFYVIANSLRLFKFQRNIKLLEDRIATYSIFEFIATYFIFISLNLIGKNQVIYFTGSSKKRERLQLGDGYA